MSALRAAYPLEEGRHIVLLYTSNTFLFYFGGISVDAFLAMPILWHDWFRLHDAYSLFSVGSVSDQLRDA